jgi:alpha-tubulin suppressor-like RCC1 family protein
MPYRQRGNLEGPAIWLAGVIALNVLLLMVLAGPLQARPATTITAGDMHSLGIRADGTVAAWGDNWYGQRNVPAGLTGAVSVAAGGNHNLALKSNGAVVA